MQIINIPVSAMYVNCYLYYDEESKEGVVIDPGKDESKILAIIKEHDVNVKGILLTHGHFDHITAVNEINEELKVPVYAHKKEVDFLLNPELNESKTMGWHSVSVKTDVEVEEYDTIKFGNTKLFVYHTPGHTAGSVCYYDEDNKNLFSGDTLFYGSVGRSDLYSGNARELTKSIKLLSELPDDTKVLPGHGRASTIGYEKSHNFFMKG